MESCGNNINFVYGVLEVAHIPINFQLRAIGVDKITISKRYFIIEFDNGYYIFINNYYDYGDICDQIELELSDTCLMPDEVVSEVIKSFNRRVQDDKKNNKEFPELEQVTNSAESCKNCKKLIKEKGSKSIGMQQI